MKTVRVELMYEVIWEDFRLGDGTLKDSIRVLSTLLESVPEAHREDAQMMVEYQSDYYGEPDDATLRIWYDRPQTTAEEIAEVAAETERIRLAGLRQEQHERETLKALLAKYPQ